MLCLVHYLFVISTSVIDCLGRFVPEMTCYVSSGTLNLTKLKPTRTAHSSQLFHAFSVVLDFPYHHQVPIPDFSRVSRQMATLEIDSAALEDPTTTYRSKSSLISDWLPIIIGGELSSA